MVSSYILEIFDCISPVLRQELKAEITRLGMIISDEKVNFVHKSSKLYCKLNCIDSHTEERFVERLKQSTFIANCSYLYKIERGFVEQKNLLA